MGAEAVEQKLVVLMAPEQKLAVLVDLKWEPEAGVAATEMNEDLDSLFELENLKCYRRSWKFSDWSLYFCCKFFQVTLN